MILITILMFTFREAFSRKILLVSVIMAAIFLGLYWTGVHYAARDIEKSFNQALGAVIYPQLLLLGLYFGGFIVSFLSIMSSVGLISAEIETGTIQSVITRPIRRSEIVLGKFLGQGIFLAVYAALMFGAICAIVRGITGIELAGAWRAVGLFTLQPVVLMSVSILASTLTGTIAGGVAVFMLYAVAVIGGVIEQVGWFIDNLYLKNAGIVSSLIMPVDALYRKIVHVLLQPAKQPLTALQQLGPFGSLAEPSTWMLVYTLAYVAAAALLAVYAFGKKDI